jgi:hypothetical protein
MTKNVKLAMKKPFDVNLVTMLWRNLLLRFMKSKSWSTSSWLAIVQVISSIENECYFYTLTFMKTKLRNRLTMHLELVIRMFSLKTFPFGVAIQI